MDFWDPRHGLWIALFGGMLALGGSSLGLWLGLAGAAYALVAIVWPLLF
jgi:hypothetical protein